MTTTKLEPIAIVGMSCRFPAANNLDAYWELLDNGINAITEIPPQRWDAEDLYDPDPTTPGKTNTRWGGFLDSVYEFDPFFFKIPPIQAARIDPQQRLILEVAWEALENAAIDPTSLSDSQTSVFIGVSHCDHHKLLYSDPLHIDAYNGPNTYYCFTANRLSYLLNLHGPSMAIDTACSSSLVAVHLACQSLRSGESDNALVGGVSINLSPDEFIALSSLQVLGSTGRCQSFDRDADGFVRGEGCGVIVLKRLTDAIADNNNILARIRGSAVNQDGYSNGITAPNGTAQQAVIRQALKNAGVTPDQISYVEAQGTATALGDSIEAIALNKVFMQERKNNQPCWVGSAKTNIGHLEAASGMAGIIKVVLSLEHKKIPKHLHFNKWNKEAHSENIKLSIPTVPCDWPAFSDSRIAGVSAFGFGGTNCHVILEEASQPDFSKKLCKSTDYILTLSAKTNAALLEKINDYIRYLDKNPDTLLADLCYTGNTGRTHFANRIAIVSNSIISLRENLFALLRGKQEENQSKLKLKSIIRKRPKIAFMFSGYDKIAGENFQETYLTQPVFRTILDRCDQIVCGLGQKSILERLFKNLPQDNTKQDIDSISQFALEYAFAKFYQSIGIVPTILVGHQIGEYAAACVAEIFTLDDAVKLILERDRNKSRTNSMNATEGMHQTRVTTSDVGFPGRTEWCKPKLDIFSTFAGEFNFEATGTSDFWFAQNNTVELQKTITKLKEEQIDILLEIGHGSSWLTNTFHERDTGFDLLLSSDRMNLRDRKRVLSNLKKLYQRGVDITWSEFDIDCSRRILQLPTYPFQRKTYKEFVTEYG